MTQVRRAAVSRFGAFLLVWLALMSWSLSSWAVGLLAGIAATWLSLRLLPPTSASIQLGAMLWVTPRLLWQALLGGWDVAWRALSPTLPLKPGYIVFPCPFQKKYACDTFATITSLLPGTLACGDADEADKTSNRDDAAAVLLYHCLDTDQPVLAALDEDARRLTPALGETTDA